MNEERLDVDLCPKWTLNLCKSFFCGNVSETDFRGCKLFFKVDYIKIVLHEDQCLDTE